MEEKILVIGKNIKQEIIGESLFDCIDAAYRAYNGQSVELHWIKPIGYIDRKELFIKDNFLDRLSVKEIQESNNK